MKANQQALLQELLQLTESASESLNKFRDLTLSQLNFKKTQETWSILECIEHLNLYGKFYLPELEKALISSSKVGRDNIYESSFLGDFFVDSIRAGNKKKMKATQAMTPVQSDLSVTTIDLCIKQMDLLKALLNQAKERDLVKMKTPISLTRFLKLRLGDTIRFLVYHNERHMQQAERVYSTVLNHQ